MRGEWLEQRLALTTVVAPGYDLLPDAAGPQQSSEFGGAVVISDSYRAVASPRADLAGKLDVGMVSVYDANDLLIATIEPPTPEVGDQFGLAMDIDDSILVVGVPRDDVGALGNSGSIFVYDLASTSPDVPILHVPNPSGTDGEEFGHSVAIDGDIVVSSAILADNGATDAGIAYVFDLSSATPDVPVTTLLNPTPAFGDRFGWSLDADGGKIVVAAFLDDFGAADSGTAYVYDLASATPEQPIHTIHNPIPDVSDQFGGDVSISGDRVAVGARVDDVGAENSGTVYVFDLMAPNVSDPLHTIFNPNPENSDQFGHAIDLDGGQLVIGAWLDSTNGIGTGNAFYYDLDSATPTNLVHQFYDLSGEVNGLFGYSVAVRGDTVVVGARTYDFSLGGAFVYELQGATPELATIALENIAPASNDRFGYAVAADGGYVAVGVPLDDVQGTNSGSVNIYDVSSGSPALWYTLFSPNADEVDMFGVSVAVDGNLVVVGAFRDDTGANDAGAAYVFDLASANPEVPILELYNPSPDASDLFGNAVDISNGIVVVSSVVDDTAGNDAGSVYVFDLHSATPTQPIHSLTDPIAAEGDIFGWSVSVSGDRVLVGAPNNDAAGQNAGRALVFDLSSATPDVPIYTLDSPNPAASAQQGYAVSMDGDTAVVGAVLGNNGQGAAYAYDLASATPSVAAMELIHPTPDVNDVFGISVAVKSDLIVVGSALDDRDTTDAGAAFVYDLASPDPDFPVMDLQSDTPNINDQFGFAVAVGTNFAVAGASLDDSVNLDQGAAYLYNHNNTAPTIGTQVFDVDEDDPGTSAFAFVEADDAESGITYSITGGTGASVFTIDPQTGDLSVSESLNFEAMASYTLEVEVMDNRGDTSFATMTINVNDINEAPVASDDSLTIDEESVLTLAAGGVLDNDVDEDAGDALGSTVTVTSFDPVSTIGATVSVNSDGSLTYDATSIAAVQALGQDEVLDDTFTYTITDSGGLTSVGTVTVTISGLNDAPVASDDLESGDEDTILSGNVLTNDEDIDSVDVAGTTLLVSSFDATSALGAVVVIQPDGSYTYDPSVSNAIQALNPGEPAVDTFTYIIADSQAATSTATVTINLTGLNDAPVAMNDTATTDEDSVLSGALLSNDEDADAQDDLGTTVLVTTFDATSALGSTVSVHPDGTFTYDPTSVLTFQELDFGDSIEDTFTYTVTDSSGIMSTATVTVALSGNNDAPIAFDDNESADEDTVFMGNVLLNDADIDEDDVLGSTVTVTAFDATSVLGATVIVNPDGTFSYDAAASAQIQQLNVGGSLTDTFTYTISDAAGLTSGATVTLIVDGANDAPDAFDVNLGQGPLGSPTNEDAPISFDVGSGIPLSNFGTDIDDTLTLAALSLGSATVTLDGNSTTYSATEVGASYDPVTGTLTLDPTVSVPLQALQAGDSAEVFVEVIVTDSGGLSDSGLTRFRVQGRNDDIVAIDDTGITDEATILTPISVMANDFDVDGDPITIISIDGTSVVAGNTVTLASGAIVTFNSDNTFSYDPNGAYDGILANVDDLFTYTVTDSTTTATATVVVTVTPQNENPVANDDLNSSHENTVLSVPAMGLLSNDTDVDDRDIIGDTVLVSAHDATSTLGALVVVHPDGSYDYDPTMAAAIQALDPGESVDDTFTYTISDFLGAQGTGTVTITVDGRNDAPVAQDDTVSADANAVLEFGLMSNDFDPDDDDIVGTTVTIFDFDAVSTLGAAVNILADGTLFYDATAVQAAMELDPGVTLTDTFTYRIEDSHGAKDTATVTVTIVGANDAPTPGDDSSATNEDSSVNGTLLSNDNDVDLSDVVGTNVLVTAFDATSAMGAVVTVDANGNFTYDPSAAVAIQELDAGDVVDDTFTYTITDSLGAEGTATVTVTLTGVNDGPSTVDDEYSINEDTALNGSVLDNDEDIDADDLPGTTVTVTSHDSTTALGLTITVNADGTFVYDPATDVELQALDAGDATSDSFNYTVTDSQGATSTATVTISLVGVNDEPIAVDDAFETGEDASLSGNVLTNDDDIDQDDVVGTSVTVTDFDPMSALGVPISVNSDGSFNYDPSLSPNVQALDEADQFTDTFTYTITDSQGTTSTATVSINLTGSNDDPIATDDSPESDEDTVLSGNVFDNDSDVDEDDVLGTTVTVTSFDTTSAMGISVVVNPDGTYTYDPTSDAATQALDVGDMVTDSFDYTITDGFGATSTATVTITLEGVNDDPIAVADSGSTSEDALLNGAGLLTNDQDVDEDDVIGTTVTITDFDSTSAMGAVIVVNPDGSYSYDPTSAALIQALDPGDSADDTFTYTITDSHGATSVGTVTVTLTGANDTPVAVDDADSTDEDTVLSGFVLANDLDADEDDVMGTTVTVISADDFSALGATVQINPDGTYTYDPTQVPTLQELDSIDAATDSFSYQIMDSHGETSIATVFINVSGVNDAPVAMDDSAAIDEDTVLTGDSLFSNDSDVDLDDVLGTTVVLTSFDSTSAMGAVVSVNPDGTYTYDPSGAAAIQALDASDVADDTFTYTVTDSQGETSTATVTVSLNGRNDDPLATDDVAQTNEFKVINIDVLANDSDADEDDVIGTVVDVTSFDATSALGAAVTLAADGTIVYDPTSSATISALDPGQVDTDTFTYTITDSQGASSTATVTVTVRGRREQPKGEVDDTAKVPPISEFEFPESQGNSGMVQFDELDELFRLIDQDEDVTVIRPAYDLVEIAAGHAEDVRDKEADTNWRLFY